MQRLFAAVEGTWAQWEQIQSGWNGSTPNCLFPFDKSMIGSGFNDQCQAISRLYCSLLRAGDWISTDWWHGDLRCHVLLTMKETTSLCATWGSHRPWQWNCWDHVMTLVMYLLCWVIGICSTWVVVLVSLEHHQARPEIFLRDPRLEPVLPGSHGVPTW